jgi:hypothetical protein
MALVSTTVWEVRTTGTDANGGGFNPARGGGGVDRSQQDAAFITIDGAVITATVNATTTDLDLTGVAAIAAHLGNLVQITGGTATAGTYEIVAIPSGTQWRLDRSAGTAGQTATGAMGGAKGSPGGAFQFTVGNNKVWVQAGTYPITSASTNISGGCIASNARVLEGYQATRGDLGTRPIFQASGIVTATILAHSGNEALSLNVEIDGAGLAGIRGMSHSTRSTLIGAIVRNCTNSGIFSTNAGGSLILNCLVTGCSTAGRAYDITGGGGGALANCVASGNTVTGFGTDGVAVNACLAYNNTGATTDGFDTVGVGTAFTNCVAYANGRDGFNNSANASSGRWVNCISESNVRNGFNGGSGASRLVRIRCSTFGNAVATAGAVPDLLINNITTPVSAFVNPAAGNFLLNNVALAGADLRGTSYPATYPDGELSARDVGALQQSSGGGSGGSGGVGGPVVGQVWGGGA